MAVEGGVLGLGEAEAVGGVDALFFITGPGEDVGSGEEFGEGILIRRKTKRRMGREGQSKVLVQCFMIFKQRRGGLS